MSPDTAPEQIAEVVRVLRAGGVVAFPTETVYGLGADASDARAVQCVFDTKQRPPTNPMSIHVCDEAMARGVCADWPDAAEKLARAFWPGPLTLVLPVAEGVPAIVTAGGPTVGVRCPDHPITLALIAAFGPIVGTSANRSGEPSPTDAERVRAAFPDLFVLDGGPTREGADSTVLSLVGEPRILRPGPISAEQIRDVVGGVGPASSRPG